MAFRLLRIVSTPELFHQRLSELKENVLIPRGYKVAKIEAAFDKVRSITREEALQKVNKSDSNKKNSDRIIVPLDYNPRVPPTGPILQKNYTAMIRKNSTLKQCFPKGPMVAHRQPPNLRKALCRARLYPSITTRPTRTTRSTPGWRPCGAGNKGQCPICPYTLPPTSEIVGLASGYRHTITDFVTCQDSNIIYYWKCIRPNCPSFPKCEYVGRSTLRFQDRYSQHRDYVKRQIVTEVSGSHFTMSGHSVADMRGCVLEKVKSVDPYVLKTREHLYIQRFNTYYAGLNRER